MILSNNGGPALNKKYPGYAKLNPRYTNYFPKGSFFYIWLFEKSHPFPSEKRQLFPIYIGFKELKISSNRLKSRCRNIPIPVSCPNHIKVMRRLNGGCNFDIIQQLQNNTKIIIIFKNIFMKVGGCLNQRRPQFFALSQQLPHLFWISNRPISL